jgi:hypothetical protein
MHLVQMLLPAHETDEAGEAFEELKKKLIKKFGGLTAFSQVPAKGVWAPGDGQQVHDDIVVVEVMTKELDRVWWNELRRSLERKLNQDMIVIRAQRIEMIE